MAKLPKVFKIVMTKTPMRGEQRKYSQVGTLLELIKAYSYSLEVGASWQHEDGNKKINRNPKSIKTLVSNLYNAANNGAANGWSGESYESVEVTEADIVDYNGRKNLTKEV